MTATPIEIDDLDEILLTRAFANMLDVAPNSLLRMASEGTLPRPIGRRGKQAVWLNRAVEDWFRRLHPDQSAYAPIDSATGTKNLATDPRDEHHYRGPDVAFRHIPHGDLGFYACPARSGHWIGNRRPTNLALYTQESPRDADGYLTVDVYRVLWVHTEAGIAGETIATADPHDTTPLPPLRVQNFRHGEDPLTTFVLDRTEPPRQLRVLRGVRRGGTISTASINKALESPGGASRFQGGVVHLVGTPGVA